MRIVPILGGSFNPAHDGHKAILQTALDALQAQEGWMLVTPGSPHKDPKTYAPLRNRLEICNILTQDDPRIVPVHIERHFSSTDTADSLTMISEIRPKTRFVWLMGSDNLSGFHTWDRMRHKIGGTLSPDWEYMLNRFPIGVMDRPPTPQEIERGTYKNPLESEVYRYAANRNLIVSKPELLGLDDYPLGIVMMDNKPMNLSATSILRGLAAGDKNIPGLSTPYLREYMVEHRLYGLNSEFNGAVRQFSKNKIPAPVPLEAMILLARTGNLVKSLGTMGPEDALKTFKGHWIRARDKAGLGNQEDLPGEIADGIISLQWLAPLVNMDLPEIAGANETQNSVNEWCAEHYPGEDARKRTENLIEELAELMVCLGLESERGEGILTAIFEAPDLEDPDVRFRKTLESYETFAETTGVTAGVCLDNRMAVNRARSTQQSHVRDVAKRHSSALGLHY